MDELQRAQVHHRAGRLAQAEALLLQILASDPNHYAGGWTADASQKVTRFVDLADTFHLPVVHLVDQPGFVIGTQAEHRIFTHHVKAITP